MTAPAIRAATVQVPNGDLQIASYLAHIPHFQLAQEN